MAIGYINTEDVPTWLKKRWDQEIELEAKFDERMYKAAKVKR
jgi:hypothetical protein